MTREHPEAHALLAGIESDLTEAIRQRDHIETNGHDQFHAQLQDHLPKLTEDALDGWLKQANALHGVRACREERDE